MSRDTMKPLNNADFPDLVETCISSEKISGGKMIYVQRDQIRLPSGREGFREFVVHPGAVIILPLLDNGHLVLERQFRYPLQQVFIELPAGKIDPGESLLVTGQRELQEETGYHASEWTYLGFQHPCIGYSTEAIYIFLARGLTLGEPQRDQDENLQIFDMSVQQCMDAVQQGLITDGKTIIALMWLEKYLNGTWQPMELPS